MAANQHFGRGSLDNIDTRLAAMTISPAGAANPAGSSEGAFDFVVTPPTPDNKGKDEARERALAGLANIDRRLQLEFPLSKLEQAQTGYWHVAAVMAAFQAAGPGPSQTSGGAPGVTDRAMARYVIRCAFEAALARQPFLMGRIRPVPGHGAVLAYPACGSRRTSEIEDDGRTGGITLKFDTFQAPFDPSDTCALLQFQSIDHKVDYAEFSNRELEPELLGNQYWMSEAPFAASRAYPPVLVGVTFGRSAVILAFSFHRALFDAFSMAAFVRRFGADTRGTEAPADTHEAVRVPWRGPPGPSLDQGRIGRSLPKYRYPARSAVDPAVGCFQFILREEEVTRLRRRCWVHAPAEIKARLGFPREQDFVYALFWTLVMRARWKRGLFAGAATPGARPAEPEAWLTFPVNGGVGAGPIQRSRDYVGNWETSATARLPVCVLLSILPGVGVPAPDPVSTPGMAEALAAVHNARGWAEALDLGASPTDRLARFDGGEGRPGLDAARRAHLNGGDLGRGGLHCADWRALAPPAPATTSFWVGSAATGADYFPCVEALEEGTITILPPPSGALCRSAEEEAEAAPAATRPGFHAAGGAAAWSVRVVVCLHRADVASLADALMTAGWKDRLEG